MEIPLPDVSQATGQRGYVVKTLADVKAVACPCGMSTRVITGADTDLVSIHWTDISKEAHKHYHERLTEFYCVVEGCGTLEVDEDEVPLAPGTVVMIKPGAAHVARPRGRLRILVVVSPPFDPADEHLAGNPDSEA